MLACRPRVPSYRAQLGEPERGPLPSASADADPTPRAVPGVSRRDAEGAGGHRRIRSRNPTVPTCLDRTRLNRMHRQMDRCNGAPQADRDRIDVQFEIPVDESEKEGGWCLSLTLSVVTDR